jgi:hypothetical protein
MDTTAGLYNVYLILLGVRGIFFILGFFVIIRIIAFWMNKSSVDYQEKLLEDILKELKEKNKE